jgi:hypothetical protein
MNQTQPEKVFRMGTNELHPLSADTSLLSNYIYFIGVTFYIDIYCGIQGLQSHCNHTGMKLWL